MEVKFRTFEVYFLIEFQLYASSSSTSFNRRYLSGQRINHFWELVDTISAAGLWKHTFGLNLPAMVIKYFRVDSNCKETLSLACFQVLLYRMKMRHNAPMELLGALYGIWNSSARHIFWLCALFHFEHANRIPKLWGTAEMNSDAKNAEYEKLRSTNSVYQTSIVDQFLDPDPTKKRTRVACCVDSMKIQVNCFLKKP